MEIEVITVGRPMTSMFTPMTDFRPEEGEVIILDPRLEGKTKLHISLQCGEARLGINVKACDDLKYHPTKKRVNMFSGTTTETNNLKWLKNQREEAIIKHTKAVLEKHFSYLEKVTLHMYPLR